MRLGPSEFGWPKSGRPKALQLFRPCFSKSRRVCVLCVALPASFSLCACRRVRSTRSAQCECATRERQSAGETFCEWLVGLAQLIRRIRWIRRIRQKPKRKSLCERSQPRKPRTATTTTTTIAIAMDECTRVRLALVCTSLQQSPQARTSSDKLAEARTRPPEQAPLATLARSPQVL